MIFPKKETSQYKGLSMDEMIRHLAGFLSRLWQIHIFGEGNTRVTAVFFIKYLSTLGFEVTNDVFAENAWYFRNALVRANYNDLKKGIHETTAFLELFLRNLLLDEHHPLRNRTLHISWSNDEAMKPDIGTKKPDIGEVKPDIESEKPDTDEKKPDIGAAKPDIMAEFLPKTAGNIRKLREAFPEGAVFGRTEVMKVLGLKASGASDLLMKLRKSGMVEAVSGQGKGKYRFILFS